ncbi:topoisomerase DNA-binding C4 zinc finger domain-containing protein [Streptococcus suis]|nr:topoisomerase DNA-binding C4 zinc finger domain-containing protein [Streptococcus suis]QZT22475.1 topoisomerase DNA-binding C4 zinc finger domain-containing protein [Streptococcus suis]
MPTKRSGPLVGKCPKCGNNIVLKKSFYGCSNYPECTFTLAEHFRKKKLTKTNVKELLEGKGFCCKVLNLLSNKVE